MKIPYQVTTLCTALTVGVSLVAMPYNAFALQSGDRIGNGDTSSAERYAAIQNESLRLNFDSDYLKATSEEIKQNEIKISAVLSKYYGDYNKLANAPISTVVQALQSLGFQIYHEGQEPTDMSKRGLMGKYLKYCAEHDSMGSEDDSSPYKVFVDMRVVSEQALCEPFRDINWASNDDLNTRYSHEAGEFLYPDRSLKGVLQWDSFYTNSIGVENSLGVELPSADILMVLSREAKNFINKCYYKESCHSDFRSAMVTKSALGSWSVEYQQYGRGHLPREFLFTTLKTPIRKMPGVYAFLKAVQNLGVRAPDALVVFGRLSKYSGRINSGVFYPPLSKEVPIPQPIIWIDSQLAEQKDLERFVRDEFPKIYSYSKLFEERILPSIEEVDHFYDQFPALLPLIKNLETCYARVNKRSSRQEAYLMATYAATRAVGIPVAVGTTVAGAAVGGTVGAVAGTVVGAVGGVVVGSLAGPVSAAALGAGGGLVGGLAGAGVGVAAGGYGGYKAGQSIINLLDMPARKAEAVMTQTVKRMIEVCRTQSAPQLGAHLDS